MALMMSYRSLLVIPLMILLGCKDYALKEPFRAPNGLYGYKDGEGKIRVEAKYYSAEPFENGTAMVTIDDKNIHPSSYGWINQSGKNLTGKYDDHIGFGYNDLCSVKLNGKWGFIDKTGKEVVPLKYDDFYRPRPTVYQSIIAAKLNGKWCFINGKGKVLTPLKYDDVVNLSYWMTEKVNYAEVPFKRDLANVKFDGKWGYVDKKGNEYWDMTEDEARQQMKNR